jgi:hypothetical protein
MNTFLMRMSLHERFRIIKKKCWWNRTWLWMQMRMKRVVFQRCPLWCSFNKSKCSNKITKFSLNDLFKQIIQEIRQGEVRGGEAAGESGENAGSSRGLSRIRNNQPLGNTTEKFFHQILSHDLVTRPTDSRFSKAGTIYCTKVWMKDNL